ncbi:MAG: DUF1592 domain-containing protein [Planctomycetaceae bacterium]
MTFSDTPTQPQFPGWLVWNAIAFATMLLNAGHQLRADERFTKDIQPLLQLHCLRCHGADKAESGVRLDLLTPQPVERDLTLLKHVRRQIASGSMPPEDEPPLPPAARGLLENWIDGILLEAARRPPEKNGAMRRLTVAQYRNTLQDLLGLREDFTEVLPPDAPSRDGFTNNEQVLSLAPLQIESCFDIARQALDACLVDETTQPVIQSFRMDFGRGINQQPYPDQLILGANSELLPNADFQVTELAPHKSFLFTPYQMQRKFRFIEGYVGNDTIREWRDFDSIYHAVFACMRGNPGYPKGSAVQSIPSGLLLRPAIPGSEIFGVSSTYGPRANFKISLRELPDHGEFRVTVRAARYVDCLLLEPGTAAAAAAPSATAPSATEPPAPGTLTLERAPDGQWPELNLPSSGVWQLDVVRGPDNGNEPLQLVLPDGRHCEGRLEKGWTAADNPGPSLAADEQLFALLRTRLPAGPAAFQLSGAPAAAVRRLLFTQLPADSPEAREYGAYEGRSVWLGVHLGLRRDCGSTLAPVEQPRRVESADFADYVFHGAINDYPAPEVEKDNVNYLAGVREIGVRSEYTDGRDLPRLLIQSITFEGPIYNVWPPETHRRIIPDSPLRAAALSDPPEAAIQPQSSASRYAREVLQSFATRAFRRPALDSEIEQALTVWRASRSGGLPYLESLRDALSVILASPQFLFLIEDSTGPHAEPVNDWELASKLAYFLWNSPPDQPLLDLAAGGRLREHLREQTERMIADSRFRRGVSTLASEWFSLERFDVLSVEARRFPQLTRDTRHQLREEPIEYLSELIRHNLPPTMLVNSDFRMLNDTTAAYYGLAGQVETGFEFQRVPVAGYDAGGVLTQAAILAGLSNGRESNPIRRGAWLARRIIAEPPDDPPPNVPQLREDDTTLSLREKLERHRNQPGCAGCHAGIDPWGLPLEQFDAGGRLQGDAVDASSTLPDGHKVLGSAMLRSYLAEDRADQVTFSILKHLSTYAVGRSLAFSELEWLRAEAGRLKTAGAGSRELVHSVVGSPIFLEK